MAMRKLSALLRWVALALPVACDSTVTRPPDVDPLGCGTLYESTCPADQYCFGDSACDAVWECQSEAPCSAAPPFLVCGCDGVAIVTGAGCPDRNAYSLNTFAALSIRGGEVAPGQGAPCDPDASEPFSVRASFTTEGLDAFDGGTVWLRRPGGGAVSWLPDMPLTVEAGAIAFESQPLSHVDGEHYSVEALLDLDGDGECDPGVDQASTPRGELDAVSFTIRFDLAAEPGFDALPCESW